MIGFLKKISNFPFSSFVSWNYCLNFSNDFPDSFRSGTTEFFRVIREILFKFFKKSLWFHRKNFIFYFFIIFKISSRPVFKTRQQKTQKKNFSKIFFFQRPDVQKLPKS